MSLKITQVPKDKPTNQAGRVSSLGTILQQLLKGRDQNILINCYRNEGEACR